MADEAYTKTERGQPIFDAEELAAAAEQPAQSAQGIHPEVHYSASAEQRPWGPPPAVDTQVVQTADDIAPTTKNPRGHHPWMIPIDDNPRPRPTGDDSAGARNAGSDLPLRIAVTLLVLAVFLVAAGVIVAIVLAILSDDAPSSSFSGGSATIACVVPATTEGVDAALRSVRHE